MKPKKSNIILIGMAGCGKSTIGKSLATFLSYHFIDTDILIEKLQKTPLQKIVDRTGPDDFRRIEEEALLSLNVHNTVIATGGSSVYSEKGMEYLKRDGFIILLDVSLPVLEKRVDNLDTRGLVRQPGQSFAGLYHERKPLYLRYADFRFNCTGLSREQVSIGIQDLLIEEGCI